MSDAIEQSDTYPWYPLLGRTYRNGDRTVKILSFDAARQLYRVRRSWIPGGWGLMSTDEILEHWIEASTA